MRISLTVGASALCFMFAQGTLQCQATAQTLSISDDRPLYSALNQLGSQFGWVVSYEDPQYEFSGDLEDMVPQRPSSQGNGLGGGRGSGARSGGGLGSGLGPGSGSSQGNDANSLRFIPLRSKRTEALSVSFDKPANFNDRGAEDKVLHRMLDAYQSSSEKVFVLQTETGGQRVIVPSRIKDAAGDLKPVTPLLDSAVTVQLKDATGSEFVDSLCSQLSKLSGVKVEPATITSDAVIQYKGNFDYSGVSARKALSEFLTRVDGGDRLFWALLYHPGYGFGLNILDVKPVGGPAAGQPVPQRAEKQTDSPKSCSNSVAGRAC